jgi:hypothetical protein
MAVECPTKLYYTGKTLEYANANSDDEFLRALADGGFQVGELAKLMFPGGVEVTDKDQEQQLRRTAELLQQDKVTIFEGAIRHGNLFARVDVMRKVGGRVELIEVKAKSFDSREPLAFRTKKGRIERGMLPYLQDIAFQRHVFALAYPGLSVTCQLMMADKSKPCSVEGLNQMFKIRREGRQHIVQVAAEAHNGGIGAPVLSTIDVDEYAGEILGGALSAPGAPAGATLAELAVSWGEKYAQDERIPPAPGSHCGRCEFRDDAPAEGMRSGFHECWNQAFGLKAQDIAKGTVLDLWNFMKKDQLIEQRLLDLRDITREQLGGRSGPDGLSRSDRQWMQISSQRSSHDGFFLDKELMRREMAGWQFPLHFIDFETARVALPYFKGQRPYENIAFQFSHHVVDAAHRVEHKSEFLSTRPGQRPNYAFLRKLREALGSHGTVFMWSQHENSTLKAIREELEKDPEAPGDAAELIAFVDSVTRRKLAGKEVAGPRAMVDLCKLAERAFFHPATKGSCSIKKVLPAVLGSSAYLRERYGSPVYGAPGGIPSLNFRSQVWWQQANGAVVDPYKLLPPVFEDMAVEDAADDDTEEFGELREGGAATTAYARLQFDDVAAAQRERVEAALKRYCELDTLAMVMIYEGWREWGAGRAE